MEEEVIKHYGTPKHSGRYPWGSGENPFQRLNKPFLAHVQELKEQGMTEAQIARGMGISTTQLRAYNSIAKTEARMAERSEIMKLKEKGMSNIAIAERMGLTEPTVRNRLKPASDENDNILNQTAEMLKDNVRRKDYIDVGKGVENHLGISKEKLATAVAMLEAEGYSLHYVNVEQLGTGNQTRVKVLAPPGADYADIRNNPSKIGMINDFTDDGGRNWVGLETPKAVDSKRVDVRYGPDGGAENDGVIEVREGVPELSLGDSRYAQIRMSIDGTHYLKGMAVYSDDLPPGVDVRFNTNKQNTGNKLDAMKAMSDDPENPFGAVVRQRRYLDKQGKEHLSAMNIVNEEGDWSRWSNNLSSQMLSKQRPELARQQLGKTLAAKEAEFKEIQSLTNPAVRKKLIESFADDADASAVHLRAAALPRQGTHVILPVNSLKDNEIYAPNFRNGENVALVRYPHGGTFEIPELRVNNRHPESTKLLGRATDAVAINSEVAARLSGADFDGDTVVVIPNNNKRVSSSKPLKGLEGFDPQTRYPGYEGMKRMTSHGTQQQMGDVSNLITDMTIRGATESEIARAVRHSMVVIDAEKHGLNYKQSAKDNGISALKEKYQGGANRGASTLISRASSSIRVPDRRAARVSEGGPIDPDTGERRWVETGDGWVDSKTGKYRPATIESTRMAEASDAYQLSSGTQMESIYADHANKLKSLANKARKEGFHTKSTPYSKTARTTYQSQVDSLNAKLNTALKNAPLERQAQLVANTEVDAKRRANPGMENDTLKKIKGQALEKARARTGANKVMIDITPDEWEAIQAGAISNNKLTQILNNTNLDRVKELATPRSQTGVTSAMAARMRAMMSAGYTQAEIADALGVSTSTVQNAVS